MRYGINVLTLDLALVAEMMKIYSNQCPNPPRSELS